MSLINTPTCPCDENKPVGVYYLQNMHQHTKKHRFYELEIKCREQSRKLRRQENELAQLQRSMADERLSHKTDNDRNDRIIKVYVNYNREKASQIKELNSQIEDLTQELASKTENIQRIQDFVTNITSMT